MRSCSAGETPRVHAHPGRVMISDPVGQTAGMVQSSERDPGADLRRIAFLLERSLASSYRVKAFRGAAAALLTLTPEELAQAAADHLLTKIKGIGGTSAAGIEEALSGAIPAYLEDPEQ